MNDESDEISHELAFQLEAMRRQECYVVEEVLKESSTEITERVHFEGANGASQGPFVRKRIERSSGLGGAYERIFAAQQAGKRFRYIPRVYDCAIIGDEIVVVMEYVFGETLEGVVRRCAPSMALAADVFPRVCDAVCELHVLARLNWWQTILAAVMASLVAIVVTMLVGWQYTQPIAA